MPNKNRAVRSTGTALKHLPPTSLFCPGSTFFFIPDSFEWCRRDGTEAVISLQHFISSASSTSHFSPATVWSPSHVTQSFRNRSSMGSSHGLQLRTAPARVVSVGTVHLEKAAPAWVPQATVPARSLLQHRLSMAASSFRT